MKKLFLVLVLCSFLAPTGIVLRDAVAKDGSCVACVRDGNKWMCRSSSSGAQTCILGNGGDTCQVNGACDGGPIAGD